MHIPSFPMTTKTVFSFGNVLGKEVVGIDVMFSICISAMERGVLHVDTTNSDGWTLGYFFVHNASVFNSGCPWDRYWTKCLWDRYWALRPDVSLFWRLVHQDVDHSSCKRRPMCALTCLREALCSTPALWTDLSLVQPVARNCVFIQEQVHARIRESCRFAWITAVVRQ
jgi:hypothetical protein